MQKLSPLGTMTVFYVPSHKLDDPRFGPQQTVRITIHEFLIESYRAYTHTPSTVKGYWINAANVLYHDVLERYEVSFDTETEFEAIVDFLGRLCVRLEEESIYLTRGDRSYLVRRVE
ncbi:MAG: hypothetical protein KF708_00310 [Pirellulales bacterium]|nr:hypothetical protein [Pirellulales bacterium]